MCNRINFPREGENFEMPKKPFFQHDFVIIKFFFSPLPICFCFYVFAPNDDKKER